MKELQVCWKALKEQSLELSSLHLVVQELNQQWANVCQFIEAFDQRQDS